LLEPSDGNREGAAKGSAMPLPPDLFDTPSEPRGATRLAQGLLIVAIMVLIVIARLSTH